MLRTTTRWPSVMLFFCIYTTASPRDCQKPSSKWRTLWTDVCILILTQTVVPCSTLTPRHTGQIFGSCFLAVLFDVFLAKGQKRTVGIEGSGEAAERRKAAAVLEVAAYGRNVDSMMSGPGFHKGPPRHVPHGSCMSLFWEYMCFMKTRGEEPASWSRFYHISSWYGETSYALEKTAAPSTRRVILV